jgi:hypothetical protein
MGMIFSYMSVHIKRSKGRGREKRSVYENGESGKRENPLLSECTSSLHVFSPLLKRYVGKKLMGPSSKSINTFSANLSFVN